MFTIDTTNHSIDLDGMRLELYSAEWQQGPRWQPLTDEGKEGPIRTFWGEGTQILVLDSPVPESDIVAYLIDEQDRRFAIVQNEYTTRPTTHILHRVYKDPHMGMTEHIREMQHEGKFSSL